VKRNRIILAAILAILAALNLSAQQHQDDQLLRVRESVWREWFAGDTKALGELVPPDTIVISAGEKLWKGRQEVIQSSAAFHACGGRLVRLEFPRTEVQHLGPVAILWSEYVVETEIDSRRSLTSGRVTEVFVRRNGRWVNAGWHTDSAQ
jgi:ketosteroid isomerase-like protein